MTHRLIPQRLAFRVAFAVILIDQVSKTFVRLVFDPGPITRWGGLLIQCEADPHFIMGWSLPLSWHPTLYRTWLFLLIILVVGLWLTAFFLKSRPTNICCALLIGGLLSNGVERALGTTGAGSQVVIGPVLDIFCFAGLNEALAHTGLFPASFGLPGFNPADCAVLLGGLGLLIKLTFLFMAYRETHA